MIGLRTEPPATGVAVGLAEPREQPERVPAQWAHPRDDTSIGCPVALSVSSLGSWTRLPPEPPLRD